MRIGLFLVSFLAFLVAATFLKPAVSASEMEQAETRSTQLRDANHYRLNLLEVETAAQWERRRAEVRETVLLSTGLWPPLKKSPLNPVVFDTKQRTGFKVSKVYFESLEGFFVTGNLYEPAEGAGPFPAVLSPHGHWDYGRLENDESGSIPGRCIDFARQGFVVFSQDMVGYNDSLQLPHDHNKRRAQLVADMPVPYEQSLFRGEFDFPLAGLYGLNLAGLQLWNSIRALDFLTSLPQVDPERIGVTGASGGATQTILLLAVDDRVKVAAPVNIIGAEKHPGCRCENPPGLWIDTSTIELAATFAPKPLLLVSATEDPWTHSTPQQELPILKRYWDLFSAAENISNKHVAAGHNYNAESRSAVYDWFSRHLLGTSATITSPEPVNSDLSGLGDLRVFPNKILPEGAIQGIRVVENWCSSSEATFNEELPNREEEWGKFADRYRPALSRVLSTQRPVFEELTYSSKLEEVRGEFVYKVEEIGRAGMGDWFELESAGMPDAEAGVVVIVYEDANLPLLDSDGRATEEWIDDLLKRGFTVFHPRGYASRQLRIGKRQFDSFQWSEAYNRSELLNSIQDIITSLVSVKETYPELPLTLVGLGSPGLATGFAAAIFGKADSVILDLDGSDPLYDQELLALAPIGSIKRVGDFRSAVVLLLDNKLTLFNAGPSFEKDWIIIQAQAISREGNLNLQTERRSISFLHLIAQ